MNAPTSILDLKISQGLKKKSNSVSDRNDFKYTNDPTLWLWQSQLRHYNQDKQLECFV